MSHLLLGFECQVWVKAIFLACNFHTDRLEGPSGSRDPASCQSWKSIDKAYLMWPPNHDFKTCKEGKSTTFHQLISLLNSSSCQKVRDVGSYSGPSSKFKSFGANLSLSFWTGIPKVDSKSQVDGTTSVGAHVYIGKPGQHMCMHKDSEPASLPRAGPTASTDAW